MCATQNNRAVSASAVTESTIQHFVMSMADTNDNTLVILIPCSEFGLVKHGGAGGVHPLVDVSNRGGIASVSGARGTIF